jgi:hypothetical protein
VHLIQLDRDKDQRWDHKSVEVKLRVQKKPDFLDLLAVCCTIKTASVPWSYLIRPSYLDGQICVV